MMVMYSQLDVLTMIRCKYGIISSSEYQTYFTIPANPATGTLFVTDNNRQFISGQIRVRGRGNGSYPYNYLEMIDAIFGKEDNTIEVCSGMVRKTGCRDCFTVDINPQTNPELIDDGQILSPIPDNKYNRWRCDPPYNNHTAEKMYGTDLPAPIKLLKAGARVCKVGSLMFLLLGPQNYQWHPKGVKRIGLVAITVVPNNELRVLNIAITVVPNNETRMLNIFYKFADAFEEV